MGRPALAQPAASPLAARFPFYYGWVVLAVAVIGMFSSGPGQASILSIFIEPIGRETGWSRTLISAGLSIATLATALAMPLTGYLVDRFGARTIIATTAVLLGLGCFAMSRVETVVGLYAGLTAVRLLGLGVISLACTTLVPRWFVRRRGRAMALAVIGMAVGLAAFPPILQSISAGAGWRTAWVFLGVVVWVLLIGPAIVLIRDRPEALGLRPDGDRAPDVTAATRPGGSPGEAAVWPLRAVVRQRTFWLLLLASATPFLVNVAVTFHQVPFLIDNGLTPWAASLTVSFYAICFSFGSLFGGWATDRWPVRNSLIGTLALLSVSVLVLMNARTLESAAAYGVTFGLAAGANSTIERVIWPTYYGRENLGRINGLVLFIRMGLASIGPLLAGMAYDRLGGYAPFFAVMTVVPIACAFVALLVGPPGERPDR